MLASLLRIILLTATLKILERGLDKGPIIFIAYRELTSQAANCEKNIHEALFPERIYDLRRFKNILKNSNTVGINSKWGNGKTFMVTHFCNETATKNEYYIIKIEALTYNYDEFDIVLVNKLG